MRALFFILILSNIILCQTSQDLLITYLANDGFLISSGEKSLLIDALFIESFGEYSIPSDSLKGNIFSAAKPFEKIDLYLVTHNHGDHFYAPYMLEYLKRHKETVLIVPSDAYKMLPVIRGFEKNIYDVQLEPGSTKEININGIPIKIYRMTHLGDDHTAPRVVNLGYLINIEGIKIFTPGDITLEHSKLQLEKFNLKDENIDILFLPYFDLSETSVKFAKEIIQPKHIVAKHMPSKTFNEDSEKFLKAFPGGIVFRNELETKAFK